MAAAPIITFTSINLRQQNFSFSKKLINQFFDKANAKLMQKFYRCCKYFYFKAPYFIVDNIYVDMLIQRFESETYNDLLNSTNIPDFQNIVSKIDNIWVTQKFQNFPSIISLNSVSLFNKIVRSDVSRLCLSDFNLTLDKFKMFIGSGNLQAFYRSFGYFIDDYGNKMPLEDVLALIPNVYNIGISYCHVTPQTMSKLLEIPWKQKINTLNFGHLDGPIDVDLFLKFISDNLTRDASIRVTYGTQNKKELMEALKLKCNEKLKELKRKWKIRIYTSPKFANSSPSLFYADKNIKLQNFQLPQPIINYMIQAANGIQMKQLQKTCKYFFSKIPYCIVDELNVNNGKNRIRFDEISYDIKLINNSIPTNIWITSEFFANNYGRGIKNNLCFEKIIARCDANRIYLFNSSQIIMKEFEILTSKFEKLTHWGSYIRIIDNNRNFVPVENILPKFLNVEELCVNFQNVKPENLTKMLLIPFKNKAKWLNLGQINELLDVNLFYELIKKMLAPKAYLQIKFIDGQQARNFEVAMKLKLREWKPKVETPSMKVKF